MPGCIYEKAQINGNQQCSALCDDEMKSDKK
jgi:hypothetical protein